MAFEDHLDARRVFRVLDRRLNRFGLTLHPEKSRFIDFRFRRPGGQHHPATSGTTFDFLGFTHVWGRSLKGKNVVRQVTAKGRFARALSAVTEWCQRNRHQPIRQQHAHLSAMLRGHYGYYGITGNGRRIRWYLHQVERVWKKWLSRRGRHGNFRWDRLRDLLSRHPLPPARITRQYRRPERSSPMKNRMREICTSGSVRGGGGNVPTYSARDFGDRTGPGSGGTVQRLESRISIGLEETGECGHVRRRMLAAAIGAVEVDGSRGCGAAERSVVAHIDP